MDYPSRLGLTLGLVLVLGGCSADRVVTGTWASSTTIFSETAYAVQGRDVAVAAHGDPFGVGEARLADIAATALRAPWTAANFTTEPGPSARPAYSVVARFGVIESFAIGELCRVPGPEVDPMQQPLRIAVAFCRAGAVQSAVWGWVENAEGPDDPAIAAFFGEIGGDLFPPPSLLSRPFGQR